MYCLTVTYPIGEDHVASRRIFIYFLEGENIDAHAFESGNGRRSVSCRRHTGIAHKQNPPTSVFKHQCAKLFQ